MSRRYQKEVHEFIRNHVEGTTTRELTAMVNEKFCVEMTEAQMKAYKNNHKLKSGTPCGLPKDHSSKTFPQPVIDFIKANHKGIGHQTMADMLNEKFETNYTRQQIKGYYHNHSLNSGLTGRFQKGHVPPNKGKKGYHAPGSEKGWFGKGHIPANRVEVGTETVDADGYHKIKVAEPNVWEYVHKIVYRQHYGEIPKGKMVVFKDGNKENLAPTNLACITLAENATLNKRKLRSKNPELTETGISLVRMMGAVRKKKQARQKEKQEPAGSV